MEIVLLASFIQGMGFEDALLQMRSFFSIRNFSACHISCLKSSVRKMVLSMAIDFRGILHASDVARPV